MPALAVVIGGSIAGMCAARVLSEVFQKVTVIDRDTYPEGAQSRKGVPQSKYPHALLPGGRDELMRLFPGFEKAMLAGGAIYNDTALEAATYRIDGWRQREEGKSGIKLLSSSRVLLESVVRKLSAAYRNVEYIEDTAVEGLMVDIAPLRVTGVCTRNLTSGETNKISADLVIDASGRGSRVGKWLNELGLEAPEVTIVDVDIGYSCRWYESPPKAERSDYDWWWKMLMVDSSGSEKVSDEVMNSGIMTRIENDRWIVCLIKKNRGDLPRSEESFAKMASALPTPALANAMAMARPISKVYSRRGMQNTWRRYDRWSEDLPGFIAVGDAVAGFNPSYGQGMTTAARCAGLLQRCMRRKDPTDPGFARYFFKKQAQFLTLPWMIATTKDNLDNTSKPPGWFVRRVTAYFGQIGQAADRDMFIERQLVSVAGLSISPLALLLDPRVAVRVAWAKIRQRMSSPNAECHDDHPLRPEINSG